METLKLKDALRIQDKNYEEAIKILYGVQINAVPLCEMYKYNIPQKKGDTIISDAYEIDGRVYTVIKDLTAVSYAQFVDFNSYSKKKDIVGMCSCFFVPKGHTYNDGYDLQQVKEDLLESDFYVISDYAFFFKKQSDIFVELFLTYSTQTLKKMRKKKGAEMNDKEEAALRYWASLLHTCKRLSHPLMKQ